jgi:hypothetical protein
MNPQNNVDSQRSMENPGPAPAAPDIRPGSSPDSNQTSGARKAIRDMVNTDDDKATAGRESEADDYNEKQDDKKRYDEADPNWRNPDVEMQGALNTPDINPELEANIGPQS